MEPTEQYTLPDTTLDHETVARSPTAFFPSDPDVVYIFPLPATLNCRGEVSAIRFCYSTEDNFFDEEHVVFMLLTLRQDGRIFFITRAITVRSTPRDQICTSSTFGTTEFCCDTMRLSDQDHFSLPAANFSFGITRSSRSVELLSYLGQSNPEFLVEHYRPPISRVGNTYTKSGQDLLKSDRALRLLHFIIGKLSKYTAMQPMLKSGCTVLLE